MRIVIVGAGATGLELGQRLSSRHQVLLLDRDSPTIEHFDVVHPPDAAIPDALGHPQLLAFQGDGTSRLILQKLYAEDIHTAMVAVSGDDETNLEVGRLAHAIGFEPIIAVQHDSEHSEAYRKGHFMALERTQLLADEIERSLRHHGAVIPRGVGFGRGELVEIRLVRTSPIIGRPLKDLRPHRWRVAAVFRGDEVIVPMGDTMLEVDDRVLLVGDPKVLPTVTEYLRLGKPHFPQPYGANIVTLEFDNTDPELLQEAEALCLRTEAVGVIRGIPDAANVWPIHASDLEGGDGGLSDDQTTFSVLTPDFKSFPDAVVRQRPGLLMTRPGRRRLSSRVLGRRGLDARICDAVGKPVLFARGTFPYKRILLPVSYSYLNIISAEVALDLTRQLNASLTAMNVDLPRFISGLEDDAVHEEVVPIRRLCELYEVSLEYRHAWGNPVKNLVAEASQHDLVVVARHRYRRDTYFKPDVALRVMREAPCSVLVITEGHEHGDG